MPRAHRGRHRGRHRRPRTHHLPAGVGTLAVATAATGALGVGGNGAFAAAPATSDVVHASTFASEHRVLADPLADGTDLLPSFTATEELLAGLEVRAQESVERSTQRTTLADTATAVEAQRSAQQQADLDQSVASKFSRFAEAGPVWAMPISGYTLTSLYGPRWGRIHTGLDMAAPSGTPIYAMSDGEIISAEYDGSYGNKTVIRLEDGTETWYCHQSAFELRTGTVRAGDLIGYVGSTGNSTGPHLHLEIHPSGGDPVNPLAWMRERGLPI